MKNKKHNQRRKYISVTQAIHELKDICLNIRNIAIRDTVGNF